MRKRLNENISTGIKKLLKKYNFDTKLYNKLVDREEITKAELKDLDYIEDKIDTWKEATDNKYTYGSIRDGLYKKVIEVGNEVFSKNGIEFECYVSEIKGDKITLSYSDRYEEEYVVDRSDLKDWNEYNKFWNMDNWTANFEQV